MGGLFVAFALLLCTLTRKSSKVARHREKNRGSIS
jgi:hypothetical protein